MARTLAQALTYALALTSLGLSSLLFCRIRWRLGLVLWPLKMIAGPLAAITAAGGALAVPLGFALSARPAAVAGLAGALLSAYYLWRATRRPHCAQSPAFCRLEGKAPAPRMTNAGRPPRWERDVPFCSLPGSGRPLLCDIWRPAQGVSPTGLALVYFHSSSWHLADKDVWTRRFFRHLAAQGHVVMDVAYRLCPEADLQAMLGDAKRAIAWMKANAPRYGADPQRVVAIGASAGGQLALLAAYTPGHPSLTPADLAGADTSVCAVVSYYGLADMRAYHAHAEALLPDAALVRKLAADWLVKLVERAGCLVPGRPIAGQAWKLAGMSHAGMMASLLGGAPEQVPAMYDLASPVTHAGPLCPPTLLIHGAHDTAVPVGPTCALYEKLSAAGAPARQVILPQTDHIFDLLLPQVSPVARAATGHLDRFLALLA